MPPFCPAVARSRRGLSCAQGSTSLTQALSQSCQHLRAQKVLSRAGRKICNATPRLMCFLSLFLFFCFRYGQRKIEMCFTWRAYCDRCARRSAQVCTRTIGIRSAAIRTPSIYRGCGFGASVALFVLCVRGCPNVVAKESRLPSDATGRLLMASIQDFNAELFGI